MSENEKYLKRDALSEGDVDGGVNIRGELPRWGEAQLCECSEYKENKTKGGLNV